VGFYSTYLVTDGVMVMTKLMQLGSKLLWWISDVSNSYNISKEGDTPNPIKGSNMRLILQLKDNAIEYLPQQDHDHVGHKIQGV
jgi:HSP90 family molecular chaperone